MSYIAPSWYIRDCSAAVSQSEYNRLALNRFLQVLFDQNSNIFACSRFLPDKAIDLMDEAAAKLKMEITSKPEKLDELDRKVGSQIVRPLSCASLPRPHIRCVGWL